MPNQTLSVRESDLPLWERARRRAEQDNTTLSSLVATALAKHLGDTNTITIAMYGPDQPLRDEQFQGRWLVHAMLDSDQLLRPDDAREGFRGPDGLAGGHDGEAYEWCAGVAETSRGRIAVYLHHWNYGVNFPPELHVFDTLKEAEQKLGSDPRIKADTWWTAQGALYGTDGRRPVVWRDI